jgi:DnaD/phage-associated family protein
MKTFSGFVSGKSKTVSVTDQFFTELLPLIDDVIELKVTLACLRLFDQQSGWLKWVTIKDLDNDPSLKDIHESISNGVAKAVQRGSILQAVSRTQEAYLFANDHYGRAAKESIERGESIAQVPGSVANRPNIYTLYEQNVGTLTPMIAEQLREAEREYSPELIEEAFQAAIRQNVRSWPYIHKILERRAKQNVSQGEQDAESKRDVGRQWQEDLKKHGKK